jgi:S1-C subfamily serine protease
MSNSLARGPLWAVLTVLLAAAALPAQSPQGPLGPPLKVRLGAAVEPVRVKFRGETHLGCKVTWVLPEGPAARNRLEVGDVIMEADGAPTPGSRDLLAAVGRATGPITLTVMDSKTGRVSEVTGVRLWPATGGQ